MASSQAWEDGAGSGVVTYNGRMVENLHVESARRTLAIHEAIEALGRLSRDPVDHAGYRGTADCTARGVEPHGDPWSGSADHRSDRQHRRS